MREGAVVDALGDVVAVSLAMKDPAEEPLDGGASTHPLSCAPAKGPTAVPSLSLIRSHLALVAARKREEGVERTSALGFGGEPSTGFVEAENPCDRRIQMNGYR
jgi:hypothetical protein